MKFRVILVVGLFFVVSACTSSRHHEAASPPASSASIRYDSEREAVAALQALAVVIETRHAGPVVFVLPEGSAPRDAFLFGKVRETVAAAGASVRLGAGRKYVVVSSFVVDGDDGSFGVTITDAIREESWSSSGDVGYGGSLSKRDRQWLATIIGIGVS